MGCFLACFGGAEDRKRRRRPAKRGLTSSHQAQESCRPLRQSPPRKQPAPQAADVSVPELREKPEQEGLAGSRKKVTFDLNVKTYEDAPVPEVAKDSVEVGDEEKGAGDVEEELRDCDSKASPRAYPANHRYQNCTSSDDEDDIDGDDEELEYDDCDTDEDEEEVGLGGIEEESYESFFSLQLEKDKQSFREVNSPKPVKVSSSDRELEVVAKGNARDRSQYVHSVLNPVENLTQWKELKELKVPMKNMKKENINSGLEIKNVAFSSEPRIKKPQAPVNRSPRLEPSTQQEVSVDASLSTWLVSAGNSHTEEGTQENSPLRSNSLVSINREDRPILGALTVEDIKQSSVTSSPRKSPNRSPDDIPIVGSVGSYWSSKENGNSSSASSRITTASDTKGIPNTTSKYREDKVVNWNSIPFETRLERALNKDDAAETCSRMRHVVC